jgi:hypothetical protein
VDAGTADTAVGLHDVVAGQGPCIMCFLPARTEESTVVRVASETGLTVERLGRGDDVLRPEEIEQLAPEQQALLRPHLGRPVCGLANALGLVGVDDGYEPAVPFVAQQAACLAVGRLLAIELGMRDLPNFVEYDGLIGPRSDALDVRRADPSCYCQQRAELIGRVRNERRRRTDG